MIDYEEKRKKLVLDMADFLMEVGHEYCPWTENNFTVAMQNFPESIRIDLASKSDIAHRDNNSVDNSIFTRAFNSYLYDYYRPLAIEKAEAHIVSERELENDDREYANQLRDFQPDED